MQKQNFKYMVWESAQKTALGSLSPSPAITIFGKQWFTPFSGRVLFGCGVGQMASGCSTEGAPGSTGSLICPMVPLWGAPSVGCPKQDSWESSSEGTWPLFALEHSLSSSPCARHQHCLSCAMMIYPKSQARRAAQPTGTTDVKWSFRITETGNASPWGFRKEKQLV